MDLIVGNWYHCVNDACVAVVKLLDTPKQDSLGKMCKVWDGTYDKIHYVDAKYLSENIPINMVVINDMPTRIDTNEYRKRNDKRTANRR